METIDETALTATIVAAVAADAGRDDASTRHRSLTGRYPYSPQHARAVRMTPNQGDVVYTSVRRAPRRLAEVLAIDGMHSVDIALRRETPSWDRRNVYTDRWRVLTDAGREAEAAREAQREQREREAQARRDQVQALQDRTRALAEAGLDGVTVDSWSWDRRISVRGDLVLDVLTFLEGRVHEQPDETEDEQPDQTEPERPRRNMLADMVARQRVPVTTSLTGASNGA